jgi:hypothetical protein
MYALKLFFILGLILPLVHAGIKSSMEYVTDRDWFSVDHPKSEYWKLVLKFPETVVVQELYSFDKSIRLVVEKRFDFWNNASSIFYNALDDIALYHKTLYTDMNITIVKQSEFYLCSRLVYHTNGFIVLYENHNEYRMFYNVMWLYIQNVAANKKLIIDLEQRKKNHCISDLLIH